LGWEKPGEAKEKKERIKASEGKKISKILH